MFSTQCQQKNCHKHMEPYIDPKTDKIYCSECDQEITNLTHFTKVQMKTMKQYKKKVQVSFSVKCAKCNKEARPSIKIGKIICPGCNVEHSHLTETFKLMLLDALKTADKDIG